MVSDTGQHRRKLIHPATLALACAACYFCADYVLNAYTFGIGWTIFWPLNGISIGILISTRRKHWPLLLLGIAIGTGAGELFDNNALASEIWQRLFSLTEVVLSAMVLPRFLTLERWLRTPQLFARFVAAVALGPAVSGIMAAIYFHLSQQQPYTVAFNNWATSDAIGIAVMLPLTLSIRSPEMANLFEWRNLARTLGTLVLASVVIVELFSDHRFPLLWMLYPTLLLVDSTLAFAGTAIALAILCLISVYATSRGHGPFGFWPANSPNLSRTGPAILSWFSNRRTISRVTALSRTEAYCRRAPHHQRTIAGARLDRWTHGNTESPIP